MTTTRNSSGISFMSFVVWMYYGLGSMFVDCSVCFAAGGTMTDDERFVAEVQIIRYDDIYPTRSLYGFFATDKRYSHRLAFYWHDPRRNYEKLDCLGYSDFLVVGQSISAYCYDPLRGKHYYLQYVLSKEPKDFHLPQEQDLAHILKSIFNGLSHARTSGDIADNTWEMTRFFSGCDRQETDYTYSGQDSTSAENWDDLCNDYQLLQRLSQGRVYSKTVQPDGCQIWQLSKLLEKKILTKILTKPYTPGVTCNYVEHFDPNSLGEWSLIPKVYHDYWAFLHRHFELKNNEQETERARDLYADISVFMKESLPDKLRLATSQLRFKVSLDMDNEATSFQAAQDYYDDYQRLAQEPSQKGIVELARIVKALRKLGAIGRVYQWVRPRVASTIEPTLFVNQDYLNLIVSNIRLQGEHGYGAIVIDEAMKSQCGEHKRLVELSRELKQQHLSRSIVAPDPCEYSTSIRRFVQAAGGAPPKGTIDIYTLKNIVYQGLSVVDANQEEIAVSVAQALTQIQRIAGRGPYQGDIEKLSTSFTALVKLYSDVGIPFRQIHMTSATLLAMSFYNTATPEDHQKLRTQLQAISDLVQSEICHIATKKGCGEVINPEAVAKVFEVVSNYNWRRIGDPFWPMCQYPLTKNEETRILNIAKLSLRRFNRHLDLLTRNKEQDAESSQIFSRLRADLEMCAHKITEAVILVRSSKQIVRCFLNENIGPYVVMHSNAITSKSDSLLRPRDIIWFYLGHEGRWSLQSNRVSEEVGVTAE